MRLQPRGDPSADPSPSHRISATFVAGLSALSGRERLMTMNSPPKAPRRPMTLTTHGDTRVDDWYWLRDPDDPEVIAYLNAENEWAEAATAHTAALREGVFE